MLLLNFIQLSRCFSFITGRGTPDCITYLKCSFYQQNDNWKFQQKKMSLCILLSLFYCINNSAISAYIWLWHGMIYLCISRFLAIFSEMKMINLFSSLKLIIVSSIALLFSYIKRFQYNAFCSFSNRNLYLYVELNWKMSCQVKENYHWDKVVQRLSKDNKMMFCHVSQ